MRSEYCIRCRRGPLEVAGVECGNPSWHVAAAPATQPGACWRCKCDDLESDACGCCHVEPCEMSR